jgi:hypothetical protein
MNDRLSEFKILSGSIHLDCLFQQGCRRLSPTYCQDWLRGVDLVNKGSQPDLLESILDMLSCLIHACTCFNITNRAYFTCLPIHLAISFIY